MIQIIETIVDHEGAQVAREPLPVTFHRAAEAKRFLDRYIEQVYPEGRRGFEHNQTSWWACDGTPSGTVHRFTLVDEPNESDVRA
jgi:hypothetical protein